MTDKTIRSKSQLKSLFTNLFRKGITDDMMSILIDVLWRNKPIMRTSGFEIAGGMDSVISWDDATRTFSIIPLDPVYDGYTPRYTIFGWSNQAHHYTKYELEELILPDEEGLFAIYFDSDIVLRTQTLHYLKNPSRSDLKNLYLKKVLISFIYWDATNKTAIHAGNDRHGSEWNPQQHWQQHRAFQAKKDSGISITGILVNEDGSDDSHAKFNVSAGQMWHDDFLVDIPEVIANATIPILYFSTSNVPRFINQTGFGILHGTNRIQYNLNNNSLAEATNGYIVAYHIFATNEHFTESRKVISVMGQNQYENLAAAYLAVDTELDAIFQYMPAQGRCHLGTIFFQTDDAYTNTPHARIVGFIGDNSKQHLPVSVDENSSAHLEINEDQKLSFKQGKPVNQVAHGFTVENAIRHNGTSFVKAQADTAVNAQTCGIVSRVIDANNFEYVKDGILSGSWTPGGEYFLSPDTAGLVTALPDPEVWEFGQVRQSLGWATPSGLNVEIDVGDEILISQQESTIEDIANDVAVAYFETKIAGFKESYIIESTDVVTIIQESSWYVTPFSEQVGNFKATVVIRNHSTDEIVTLSSIMGFDYSILPGVSDDNLVISDATITMVLSVDATSKKLQATISGMPSDNKRIHLCFERCILNGRPQQIIANFGANLDMQLSLQQTLPASANMGMDIQMAATLAIPPPVDAFVTEWTVPSGDFTFPTYQYSGKSYNAVIDWGDGSPTSTITSNTDPNRIHNYANGGTYQILITGLFEQFYIKSKSEATMLDKIIQWGDVGFTSFGGSFSGSSNLTELPTGSITGAASNSTFSSAFKGCTSLVSVPANIFDSFTTATMFQSIFQDCTSLSLLPDELFRYNTAATNFAAAFISCSSLTTIPDDLFQYNTLITTFNDTFNNSRLATIPVDIFRYNTLATNFTEVFRDTSITSIPADTFKYNTAATTFLYSFAETNIASVPVDLFRYNTQALTFQNVFSGTPLTTVPADTFRYNTLATNFHGAFYASTSFQIPAGLFDYNIAATDFSSVFAYGYGVTSIPVDLFKYNVNVTSFDGVFSFCNKVTTIPADLFRYNTLVTTFKNAFMSASKITAVPSDVFLYNPLVNDLDRTFYNCLAVISDMPDLWNDFPLALHTQTFYGCTNATNYASIPADWK